MHGLVKLVSATVVAATAFLFGCSGNAPAERDAGAGERAFNALWGAQAEPGYPFGGLGPVYSRASCSGCHTGAGRGRPPDSPGHPMLTMVVFLGWADADGGTGPHPAYGRELSPLSVPGVPREGKAALSFRSEAGTYGDGQSYTLRRPRLELRDLAFGALGQGAMVSARIAQPLHGMGLLERVPEYAILALEDAEDRDGDGISGRANRLTEEGVVGRIGRFGWKASQPSLVRQNAVAFHGDMGITTPVFPEPNCPPVQKVCLRAAAAAAAPNATERVLNQVTGFVAGLPAPAAAAGGAAGPGRAAFAAAGCDACHVPSLPDGTGGRVAAYTDLLLHDMGDGLADGFRQGGADGREWRTAPLWGVGATVRADGSGAFLHDGRARTLAQAILWHGGEAAAARERFRTMPARDRAALLDFLNSL